jgi:hypothetical protein
MVTGGDSDITVVCLISSNERPYSMNILSTSTSSAPCVFVRVGRWSLGTLESETPGNFITARTSRRLSRRSCCLHPLLSTVLR